MRRQWLGDDHDVRKYCLLKFLSDALKKVNIPFNLLINWMPTGDENLNCPECYEKLVSAIRGFKTIEQMSELLCAQGLPHLSFPSSDQKDWSDCVIQGQNTFVFFDPNTGIEANTIKKGEENNYLYYDEISTTYNCRNVRGILIYQHAIRAGKNGESKSTAQKRNIREKIDSLHNRNLPEPLIFLGCNKQNKKNEFCFEEAYILIIKEDAPIDEIKNAFPRTFQKDFLELVEDNKYFEKQP